MDGVEGVILRRAAAPDGCRRCGRLAEILSGITDAFFSLDRDWRFVLVNAAAERAPFGRPAGELIGKVVWEAYPVYAGSSAQQRCLQAVATGRTDRYEVLSPLDGRWYETWLRPHDDGLDVFLRDIDERKRGEAALRASEERYRRTLDGMMEGCAILSPDWKYLYVNEVNAAHARLPRDRMIGRSLLELLPGVEDSAFYVAYERCMRERTPQRVEAEYTFADGASGWYEVRVEPVPEGIFVLSMEVTERRLREIARARELERSNRDLDQFAQVAAHDLQQPLTQLTGALGLLAQGRTAFDAGTDHLLRIAEGGAARMASMIQGLLAYARVGGAAVAPVAVPADDALGDALANLGRQIECSAAVVTSDPLPVVRADRQRLALVFQNLIGNALKYHGSEPPRVHVRAERRDRETEFAVADHGIGIPPEHHEAIFEAFHRLASDHAGTGLGLAICNRIVQAHGGRIWVESAPGAGATFRFTLRE